MVNARAYACASYMNGRECRNGIHVRRDLVEDRLLTGIRETLGRDDMLDEIERQVREVLAAARQFKPDVKRIAALKSQFENLLGAIAMGGMRFSPQSAANSWRLRRNWNSLKQFDWHRCLYR